MSVLGGIRVGPRALRWTSRRRDDAGASAVEFALVATLLITLLFGIIQYGMYMWAIQAGSHAAREAARRLAVASNCTTLQTYVEDRVDSVATNTPTVTRSVITVNGDDAVTVRIQFHSLDLNFPFVPFINDGAVDESATSRVENTPAAATAC